MSDASRMLAHFGAVVDAGISTKPKDGRYGPPPPLTCGGCPSRWSGLGRAHCSACHLTFTGVTAFDRHRSSEGECLLPPNLGMVLRDGGLWGAPPLPPEEAAKIWKKELADA